MRDRDSAQVHKIISGRNKSSKKKCRIRLLAESKKGKLIKTERKIVVTRGWDGGIGEMVFRDANLQ